MGMGMGMGMRMRYNRQGTTSYERQLGQVSAVPTSSSFIEVVKRQGQGIASSESITLSDGTIEEQTKNQRSQSVSKATLLQKAVQSRGGGSQHTRMWSKSSGNTKDNAKSKEEEEWDEELKRMEGRERARQIGGNGGS